MPEQRHDAPARVRSRNAAYRFLGVIVLLGLIGALGVATVVSTTPGLYSPVQAFVAGATAIGVLSLAVLYLLFTVGRNTVEHQQYVPHTSFQPQHVAQPAPAVDSTWPGAFRVLRDRLDLLEADLRKHAVAHTPTDASEVAALQRTLAEEEERLADLETKLDALTVPATPTVQELAQPGTWERPVIDVEGIGPATSRRLRSAGVRTVQDLRDADADDVARRANIKASTVHDWQAMAGLMDLPGIGPQYSELLVKSGVRTVPQLAEEDPDRLLRKFEAVERQGPARITRARLGPDIIQGWIDAARSRRGPAAPRATVRTPVPVAAERAG